MRDTRSVLKRTGLSCGWWLVVAFVWLVIAGGVVAAVLQGLVWLVDWRIAKK